MDEQPLHAPTAGAIRRLWPAEATVFEAHLSRLDAHSLRRRFAGAVPPSFVKAYGKSAIKRAIAVYGWFDGPTLRAAAELHGPPFAQTGEAAFSVEPAYQGRGIGTALMERVVLSARNSGMRRLVVSCLAENSPMQKIARRHEAEIEFHTGETIGTVHPTYPNGLSLLREAIIEGHGLAHSMINLHTALLARPARSGVPEAAPHA